MSRTPPATAIVASGNLLLARGVLEMLRSVSSLTVIDTVHEAGDAVEQFQREAPDVIVIDAGMVRAVRQLLLDADCPGARVVIVGSARHIGTTPDFDPACACAYVSGHEPKRELLGTLGYVSRCSVPSPGNEPCRSCPVQATLRTPELPLSPREYEIFVQIGLGEGTSSIARALKLSIKTVETHREAIKRKLGLKSASALTTAAIAWRAGHDLMDGRARAAPPSGPSR